MPTGRRPVLQQGADAAEVDVDAGVGPGLGTAVAVEQDQQPGADVAGEADGQLVGAVLDPGTDRQHAVVFQQLEVDEDLGHPKAGSVSRYSRTDFGELHRLAGRAFAQHHRQAVHSAPHE
ncbi:hypothetical protein ACFZBZ_17045 [Streptomyces sp. NPDC008196]|uniref:hypothetical protein n=1 Tax=Streptomyces sp. NPDC008196 TaxID=3364819 RepID=UPI0036E94C79